MKQPGLSINGFMNCLVLILFSDVAMEVVFLTAMDARKDKNESHTLL